MGFVDHRYFHYDHSGGAGVANLPECLSHWLDIGRAVPRVLVLSTTVATRENCSLWCLVQPIRFYALSFFDLQQWPMFWLAGHQRMCR